MARVRWHAMAGALALALASGACHGARHAAVAADPSSGLAVSALSERPLRAGGGMPSGSVEAATATPDGFVALVATPSLDVAGALLLTSRTSADGRHWQDRGDPGGALAGVTMSAMARTRLGLVAVGARIDDQGGLDAAALWSPDGVLWQGLRSGTFAGAGDQHMAGVVETDAGLVAVGQDASRAVAWLSRDGRSWSVVPIDGGGGDGSAAQPVTVLGVCGGTGGLVALGRTAPRADGEADPGAAGAAVAWHSTDGTAWQRSDAAAFGGDGVPLACSVGPGGFVAVGAVGRTGALDGAAWRSSDGVSWQRAGGDLGGARDQVLRSVAASGAGLVAAGDDEAAGPAALAVWRSVDGTTWRRQALGPVATGGRGDRPQGRRGELVVVGLAGTVALGHLGPTPTAWLVP